MNRSSLTPSLVFVTLFALALTGCAPATTSNYSVEPAPTPTPMEQESGEVADPVEEETRYYADIPNLRGYTESQARDWGVRNSNWVSFASRNGGFNASADCLTNGWGTVTSQTPAPGQVELTGGRIQVTVAIDCG